MNHVKSLMTRNGFRQSRAWKGCFAVKLVCGLVLGLFSPLISAAQVNFVGRVDTNSFVIPTSAFVDAAGNLYVTNVGSGSITKRDPAGNETNVGGAIGLTAVAVDSSGNIYFTNFGNNCVEEQPAGGGSPVCLGTGLSEPQGLAIDSSNNLYVADLGNQRVVEISTGGTQTTLATGLSNAYSVAVDKAGNVYVASFTATSIAKIPAGGGSTTTVGSGLSVPQGVAVDADENLFVTENAGTAVEITAAGVQSTLPIPSADLANPLIPAVDAAGNLYIPNRNNSLVVEFNTHQANLGYANVCSAGAPAPCSQTATLYFSFGPGDTFASAIYTTNGVTGGAFSQSSTTCTTSSNACSIVVLFTPAEPGLLYGAVTVTDSEGNSLAVPMTGVGFGPQITFNPSTASAAITGFTSPYSLVFDGNGAAGNSYITDNQLCEVLKLTSSGVKTIFGGNGTCGYSGDGGLATSAELDVPLGIAIDGAGDLLIADKQNQVIRKINSSGHISSLIGTPQQSGYTGDGGAAGSAKLHSPSGVAIDWNGNLYIADTGNNVIRKVDYAGIITTFAGSGTAGFAGDNGPAAAAELNGPQGLAVDYAGNLYIADTGNNVVRRVNVFGIITTYAGNHALGAGFSGNGGAATSAQLTAPVAISPDASGDLFIFDHLGLRRVDASGTITAYGPSPLYNNTTGTGTYNPAGFAFDGVGNLAIVDATHTAFVEVARATPASIAFPGNVSVNSTSSAIDVTLTNAGNQPLDTENLVFSSQFDGNGPDATCMIDDSVNPGLDCILGLEFAPTAGGPASGSATITDNNLNAAAATQTITLSGTATLIPTVTTLMISANPITVGQPLTFTGIVSPIPSGSPVGNVNFMNGATLIGSGTPDGTGTATFMTSSLTAGTLTVTANYAGNTSYAASSSASQNLVVNPAKTATTVTVAATQNTIFDSQSVTFTATISPAPSGSPLGTVTFTSGVTVLGMASPNSSGVATLMTSNLAVGSDSIVASYSGNSGFASANSAPFTETVNPAFSVNAAQMPYTVLPGGSVQVTVNVPPLGGAFNSLVTMTESGAPSHATVSFMPASVTPGAAGASTIMTVSLVKPSNALPENRGGRPFGLFLVAAGLCAFACYKWRAPRRLRMAAAFAVLVLAAITFAGCAGVASTGPFPPGLYTVTITGTSGSYQSSTTVVITVQ